MLRTIIVEDNSSSFDKLKELLNNSCPQVEIIGKYTDSETAFRLIDEAAPDLVISNIIFSDKNVFEHLDRLSPFNFEIILIADNVSHTLTAFKYGAIHYLLRPVDVNELREAILRVSKAILERKTKRQFELLFDNVMNHGFNHSKITIPTSDGYVFVDVADIIRCEANGTYTYIYTTKPEKIIASKNIKEYELMLPKNQFFRIHNSHLINLNKVVKYTKGRGGMVTMIDGIELDVASRRRLEFLEKFQ